MKILQKRVTSYGISSIEEEHIAYALRSNYAQGDMDKAFELLLIVADSIAGVIRGYTPSLKLLGAENRQMSTCYLDSLLFAMFARLDCFEGLLHDDFSDEPRRKLSMLLRIWVNMLRSGKLITTDLVCSLSPGLTGP